MHAFTLKAKLSLREFVLNYINVTCSSSQVKSNRSDSTRPESPRRSLCNRTVWQPWKTPPTLWGCIHTESPSLPGSRACPGLPSGTSSTGPLLSLRLHYHAQAASRRRSPQGDPRTAREDPAGPPQAFARTHQERLAPGEVAPRGRPPG